jgi:hypothetical protein
VKKERRAILKLNRVIIVNKRPALERLID